MSEIRETVARRLVEVFLLGNGGAFGASKMGGSLGFTTPPNADEFPRSQVLDFRPVADECIRQMEWNRLVTIKAYELAAFPPICVSQAPDGWEAPFLQFTPTLDPADEKVRKDGGV